MLSQRMRRGDGGAALSLVQRRRALQGIAKHGSSWRIKLMNLARLAKLRLKKLDRESEDRRIKARAERQLRERDAACDRMLKQAASELQNRLQNLANERPMTKVWSNQQDHQQPWPKDRTAAAMRILFGTGTGNEHHRYREGECRPVRFGEACHACGWEWGNREPHIIR